MSVEMIEEFIGKQCSISVMGSVADVMGKIAAAQDGWIKVEEKKNTRLINAGYIRDITIKKEN